MYPSNPGNRTSWNPQDDPRMRSTWGNDDRGLYRGREEQNLPHPHPLEDRNLLPPTMLPHQPSNMQPPDPHYNHPQHPLPPPSEMWAPREPMHPVQPAPRQRTAIACRYCRRRKIRCSGFDSSADGRCSNCLRFNQECVFTPVSSQTQAFVPAHTQYPHLKQGFIPPRGGPARPVGQLYGSYGQPLPLNALQHPQGEYVHQNYPRPPSPGHSSHYSRPYDDPAYERDRARRDDRPPSLPPLAPSNYPQSMMQRRGSAGDYPPHAWRNGGQNPPSSPPATLPPPRQFSPPPRNNNYPNGSYPPSTHPNAPHGSYSTDYDRQYYGGQPQQDGHAVPQRRLSDPRDNDSNKDHRYGNESSSFPYGSSPAARSANSQIQSPPRSSSAGPGPQSHPPPSHPMQLSNLIDPNPPHRSDADTRMLKSLAWKP